MNYFSFSHYFPVVFLWSQRENAEYAFQKNQPQILQKDRNLLFPPNILELWPSSPMEWVGSRITASEDSPCNPPETRVL